MKLLFDENLAPRLARDLADLYPGSEHVAHLLNAAAADRTVWNAARAGEFVLVTKDQDFQQLSVLRGTPPKVIWIRLGNCATADIQRLLRVREEDIRRFLEHEEASFLALG